MKLLLSALFLFGSAHSSLALANPDTASSAKVVCSGAGFPSTGGFQIVIADPNIFFNRADSVTLTYESRKDGSGYGQFIPLKNVTAKFTEQGANDDDSRYIFDGYYLILRPNGLQAVLYPPHDQVQVLKCSVVSLRN